MSMKGKIIIKLSEYTPEKLLAWKQMEGILSEMAHERGVRLEDVIYDDEVYTKTTSVVMQTSENYLKVVVELGKELSRYALNKGVTTEIVSLKEFERNITNLNMYSAKKLIDESEKSIEILKVL